MTGVQTCALPILKTKVDPAVLGGIRLDIEGTELDGTVQNRLAALRRDIASVTL